MVRFPNQFGPAYSKDAFWSARNVRTRSGMYKVSFKFKRGKKVLFAVLNSPVLEQDSNAKVDENLFDWSQLSAASEINSGSRKYLFFDFSGSYY